VPPPKFWKQQAVDKSVLTYTLTWINQSAVDGIETSFTDGIPDKTAYVANSLQCQAKGTSKTTSCSYNPALNRIEWAGQVGADAGHTLPSEAVNSITVIFKVEMNSSALEVYNQGFGRYGTTLIPNVPSDWIDTPQLDDPTVYVRKPEEAAIVKITNGVLANTGQLIVTVLVIAGLTIVGSAGYVYWTRRTLNAKAKK